MWLNSSDRSFTQTVKYVFTKVTILRGTMSAKTQFNYVFCNVEQVSVQSLCKQSDATDTESVVMGWWWVHLLLRKPQAMKSLKTFVRVRVYLSFCLSVSGVDLFLL